MSGDRHVHIGLLVCLYSCLSALMSMFICFPGPLCTYRCMRNVHMLHASNTDTCVHAWSLHDCRRLSIMQSPSVIPLILPCPHGYFRNPLNQLLRPCAWRCQLALSEILFWHLPLEDVSSDCEQRRSLRLESVGRVSSRVQCHHSSGREGCGGQKERGGWFASEFTRSGTAPRHTAAVCSPPPGTAHCARNTHVLAAPYVFLSTQCNRKRLCRWLRCTISGYHSNDITTRSWQLHYWSALAWWIVAWSEFLRTQMGSDRRAVSQSELIRRALASLARSLS